MKACTKNSIETLPLYRLVEHSSTNFEIIRWVGLDRDEMPELVAGTTSKEAALAVLRLFDVDYEDWTKQ